MSDFVASLPGYVHGLPSVIGTHLSPELAKGFELATIPNMLEAAFDNMTWGREYLSKHSIPQGDSLRIFFNEALMTIERMK